MGCDFWVAANGSDTANGSEATPFATFQKGYDALCPPPSGASGKVACNAHGHELDGLLQVRDVQVHRVDVDQVDPRRDVGAPAEVHGGAQRHLASDPWTSRVSHSSSAGASPSSADRGIKINADYVLVKGFEVKKANDNCIHIQGTNDTVENGSRRQR